MPYDLELCNIYIIAQMYTGSMMLRRGLTLAGLVLGLWAGALPGPAAAEDAPYNVKTDTLTDTQTRLLLQNNYKIREDGTVMAVDGSQPMSRGDMPYVIKRLESGQRLKALLQIDLILSKSEGEKNLTAAERDSIRQSVKENWALFSLKARRNFRSYFSLQELELMDLVPLPGVDLQDPELKDQEASAEPAPSTATVAAAPAKIAVPVAAAPSAAAVLAASATIVVPVAAAPSAVAVLAASATIVVPVAAAPSAATVLATPATIVAPAAAAPSTAGVSRFVAVPAPPPPAAAPAALPPSGAEPPLAEVTAAAFEKFLAEAPYGHEVKALLRLVSEQASFTRNRVLNDVMTALPQIVIDPDRAGERTHSRLVAGSDGAFAIALNNGVALLEKPKLLFGATTSLLPRAAKTYAELGLPVPALQALQGEAAPQKQERGPWGDTAVYADGSRRALCTPEDQAGALLADLVRLDSHLRAWDGSPYATEIVARTAQWLFYDAVAHARRGDAFLDPLTRASYHQWLTQPSVYHDHLLLGLTAGRNGTVDWRKVDLAAVSEFDRRALSDCVKSSAEESAYRDASARQARTLDLAGYEASGLFGAESLAVARAAAAQDPAEPASRALCRPEWASELAALPKSEAMLGQALDAEKHMRREREAHAEKD